MKKPIQYLEDHQEEMLNTFEEMRKPLYEEIIKLEKKVDVINKAQAKFMSEILMSQTKWKLDENN